MWKCPVCDQENTAATVCPTCGYDRTCDYERYPTAFTVKRATPTRTLRRQWQAKQNPPVNGRNRKRTVTVTQEQAAQGCQITAGYVDGQRLEIAVPAGTKDGIVLRCRGLGQPGSNGGKNGDLLVTVRVQEPEAPKPKPAPAPTAAPAPAAVPAKKKSGLWKVLLAVAVIAIVIAAVNQEKSSNGDNLSVEYTEHYAGDYVNIKLGDGSISDQMVDDTQNLLKEHSCTKIEISGGTVDAAAMEQISKLTDVETIVFYHCTKVSGFDRLSGMPNLSSIDLTGSSESELDLTGIEKNRTLSNLYIFRFKAVDLKELSSATQLASLSVTICNITSLNGLEGLTNLKYLDVSDNQISDLRPLSALTNLARLSVYGNQISNLQPLSPLVNLESLDVSGNQISDLQPLSPLVNLSFLYVDNNQISDLRPLSTLTNLYRLYIRNNNITTLAGLENLTDLTRIYASGNPLTDTSALEVSGCMDALHMD